MLVVVDLFESHFFTGLNVHHVVQLEHDDRV